MHHYVGNLHASGNANSNLESFEADAETRDSGIADLLRQAVDEMQKRALRVADLAMTEDGHGIGTISLDSSDNAPRN